jgi:chromosome segregation ATPase
VKILGLKVENIKKVKAVEINPSGPVVKLSGDNGAGKSSIMDSIAYAIGGKRLIPENPIRKGEDKAEITVELDDLTVTRKFTRKDAGYTTTLKVTAKDGANYGNGQEVLDRLIGKLSFDPFEFSQMDEKKQADLLKGMVDLGIDLAKWDTDYKALYQERTIAGREADRLKAAANSMPKHEGVPDAETPASAIATEYQEAVKAHDAEKRHRENIEGFVSIKNRIMTEIEQIENSLAKKEEELSTATGELKRLQAIPAATLPDLTEIKTRMDSVESVNAKVRANHDRKKAVDAARDAVKKHEGIDKAVSAKLAEKETAIKSAKYPVDGLAFEGDTLTYNAIPLAQASSGEQIIISARIGMALNPTLKVLLIRNASLIGTKNFEVLSAFAQEQGYQMWCEYVDTTGEIGIYIEDGEVK